MCYWQRVQCVKGHRAKVVVCDSKIQPCPNKGNPEDHRRNPEPEHMKDNDCETCRQRAAAARGGSDSLATFKKELNKEHGHKTHRRIIAKMIIAHNNNRWRSEEDKVNFREEWVDQTLSQWRVKGGGLGIVAKVPLLPSDWDMILQKAVSEFVAWWGLEAFPKNFKYVPGANPERASTNDLRDFTLDERGILHYRDTGGLFFTPSDHDPRVQNPGGESSRSGAASGQDSRVQNPGGESSRSGAASGQNIHSNVPANTRVIPIQRVYPKGYNSDRSSEGKDTSPEPEPESSKRKDKGKGKATRTSESPTPALPEHDLEYHPGESLSRQAGYNNPRQQAIQPRPQQIQPRPQQIQPAQRLPQVQGYVHGYSAGVTVPYITSGLPRGGGTTGAAGKQKAAETHTTQSRQQVNPPPARGTGSVSTSAAAGHAPSSSRGIQPQQPAHATTASTRSAANAPPASTTRPPAGGRTTAGSASGTTAGRPTGGTSSSPKPKDDKTKPLGKKK